MRGGGSAAWRFDAERHEPGLRRAARSDAGRGRGVGAEPRAHDVSPIPPCRRIASATRPGRTACAACSPARARASCRWSRTRTSRFGGVMLERLCTALRRARRAHAGRRRRRARRRGRRDGADRPRPCIERLSERVSYLPARGLPIRFVDATGSTARVAAARSPKRRRGLTSSSSTPARPSCAGCSRAPRRHAATRPPCPLVLADDRPRQRHPCLCGDEAAWRSAPACAVHDLLLGAAPQSPRAERIASQMASCADSFFGAVLRDWARDRPGRRAPSRRSLALRRSSRHRLGARADWRRRRRARLAGALARPLHRSNAFS